VSLCYDKNILFYWEAAMLQGLRTVIYHVSDLAAATTFYTSVVGHGPYFNEPFYVGFNVGGYELGLLPDGDGVATYWGTSDIVAEHARLISLGARAKDAITDVGDGIKTATVIDPFGNVVGIIENPHFSLGAVG
jgi:predicted enzyme related to lactoylglutathione lyase